MTLLLIGDLDFSIRDNDLSCDNKKSGYCRRPKDMKGEKVIL